MTENWRKAPIFVGDNAYISVCNGCMIIGAADKIGEILTAMGVTKTNSTERKAHWAMNWIGYHCSSCGYKCETTVLPDVCPSCNSMME